MGIYFGGLEVESNLPIFHLPKLHSVIRCHHYCKIIACVLGLQLNVPVESTAWSLPAYEDIAFPKSFDQGEELACLSTRGRRSK